MRDLAEVSGLPRTTIHYYLREGLLAPPDKSAANTGVYGPEHVERLCLIRALRTTELGPFTMRQIREILALVDDGVDPGLAVVRYVSGDTGQETGNLTLNEVSAETGLPPDTAKRLVSSGLIVANAGGTLDGADLSAARSYARILELTGLEPEDLAPIGDLIHELTRYEETISRVAAARVAEDEQAGRLRDLHRMFQSVHQYLIIRHRSAGQE